MRRRHLLALLARFALLLPLVACHEDVDYRQEARVLTQGGDPQRGYDLIRHYGCGSCHVVPGVPGAKGLVGPSLASVRERAYVGGVLTHTPENLIRWIEDPQVVDPRTAMPDLGVTHGQARDIAAYLYALER